MNLFPAQKIRHKTVEVPFEIPGASIEQKSNFRVNPIVDGEIIFMLEFDQYSSD